MSCLSISSHQMHVAPARGSSRRRRGVAMRAGNLKETTCREPPDDGVGHYVAIDGILVVYAEPPPWL